MPRFPRNVLLVFIVALLSACAANRPAAPVHGAWAEHRARLQALLDWEARGKLALRSSTGSDSAGIVWRQAGKDTEVRLSGPLGVAPTLLHSDGEVLAIERGGERQVLDLDDPGAVRAATGWAFPVTALPHWLKGMPDPKLPLSGFTLDEQTGVPAGFTQSGWTVAYEAHGQFGAFRLPTRMVIRGGDARATVIVREWYPGPPRD